MDRPQSEVVMAFESFVLVENFGGGLVHGGGTALASDSGDGGWDVVGVLRVSDVLAGGAVELAGGRFGGGGVHVRYRRGLVGLVRV